MLGGTDMSNRTLRERISKSLAEFRAGRATRAELIDAVVLNGGALEMMPYRLIREIDAIEFDLTVSEFDDEDGVSPNTEQAMRRLDAWLEAIPLESEE
jgi:hypothetical protein